MRIHFLFKKALSIILFTAIVVAIFLIILEIVNLNRISFGVRMAGIDIGGKKTNEIMPALEDRLKNFEITFKKDGETLTGVPPQELGISILTEDSIKKAHSIGKRQNIFLGLKEQVGALFLKTDVPLSYTLGEEEFLNFITANFEKFETKSQNAGLVFNKEGSVFNITAPKEGFLLQGEKLRKDLNQRISFLDSNPIFLEFKKAEPEIKEEGVLEAKEIADRLISNSPYFIFYKNEKRKIDIDSFLDWMIFAPDSAGEKMVLKISLSQEKIQDFLIQLSPVLNFPPRNARLAVENDRVTAFSLSYPGRELKIEESAKKIVKGILEDEKKEIELEFAEIQPEITTASIENIGITTLLGKGTSSFAGSPANRIHNIKLGVAKLQGVLIKAGEEFSFNETVGEVDEKNGFLPELVIKQDETTPEPGGGMCQVSTTLFRAAINTGLEIIERYPHAFPVAYYSPQGFDATVYPPHPDLKFRNDTPSNILIQGTISGSTITFEFYGTNDGRKIVVSPPQEYDKKADGSMKAKFEREIWKDEKLIKKETFYSSYKSPKLYPVKRPE